MPSELFFENSDPELEKKSHSRLYFQGRRAPVAPLQYPLLEAIKYLNAQFTIYIMCTCFDHDRQLEFDLPS